MPGVIKTTAARRRTYHDHSTQSAAHDERTSKTNAVERNTGTPEFQILLEKLQSLHPDGSQTLDSDRNFTDSGITTTSNWDQRHEDNTCHVRVPTAEKQLQSPRKEVRLNPDDKPKSYAFGWETYPTRATKNEVCIRFLRNACPRRSNCHRIHPRHKPLPPVTRAVRDQECRNGNNTHMPEGYSAEGSMLQGSRCTEDSFHTQVLSEVVVKPPQKCQNRVPLESAVSQRLIGQSNIVLKREGKGELTSKVHSRDRSNKPSFNLSLPNTSGGPTDFPLPSDHGGSDAARGDNSGYSDLQWDPQTGFWGYHTNERAWTDSIQSSDGSTSDSSIFSTSNTSSQSSLAEGASDPIGTDQSGCTVKHPPPKNSVFCRDWLLNRCSRQHRCYFVHGDLEYDPPVRGRHPPPLSSETCRNWLRNQCNYGYACHFTHGDIEYDPPTHEDAHPAPRSPPTATTQNEPNTPSDIDGTDATKRKATIPMLSVTVHDHTKVKLTAGFDIRDVITGFETHWVFLDNIPIHVTTEDINMLLQPFGRVMDVRWRTRANSSTQTARVRLSTPAEARQACITLNNAQAFDTTIGARLPVNDGQKSTVFQDTAVRVQWAAPSKVAYGGYSSMERANKAIEAARIPFRDHLVKASVHVGLPVVGVVTVRFHGVPPDANEGDMERFAHPDDVVWERPNYSSLPRAVNCIKRILEEDAELISFEVLPPPYKNGATVCAWAHFPTPGDAKAACNRLHGRRPMFTGKTLVFARHVRSLSYSLPPTTYESLDIDLQLLRRAAWFRGRTTISLVIRNPLQPVLVKLSGEDIKELGQLKSEFEKILNGEVVRQDGKVAWDGFLARPAGNLFIAELEHTNPGVTIQRDDHRQRIRLLGSAQNRGKVREKLLTKLHELRSQHVRTLPLDGRLVSLFMSKDLMMLQEELGFENVTLDIYHRNLQIRGNDVAYEAARAAICRARSCHPEERSSNTAECPVCFNQVTARITLPCGHCWCRACLKNYFTSSIGNKYFPLTCLANEAKCTERIPLNLAREILTVSEFDAVVNAAFSAYIQSKPDEFHYCPSPDCPQIYRTAARDTVLQCPSCLIRLCPNCHVEAHDGFACPESGDNLFQEWMKNHDVKNCPGCKIPIERAEGCNHMTCTQCQTHICWVCLQTFPRGEGIYDHMRSVHGGIGLGPVL